MLCKHIKHAFEQREQTFFFFFARFLNVIQKKKAKQEKPKHEFAYTVVVLLHLAG